MISMELDGVTEVQPADADFQYMFSVSSFASSDEINVEADPFRSCVLHVAKNIPKLSRLARRWVSSVIQLGWHSQMQDMTIGAKVVML